MADEKKTENVPVSKQHTSEIPQAKVKVTEGKSLQVEFRIDDLVQRLAPGTALTGPNTSCGGCDGCSGCSM